MVADMRFAANNSRPDKGAIDSGPTLTTRLSRSLLNSNGSRIAA